MRLCWLKSRHSRKICFTVSWTLQILQWGTLSWGINIKYSCVHLVCPILNLVKITSVRLSCCIDEFHGPIVVLRGPAVLRGYFFIYRVLSTSLLSGIKCTMWNYMTPPSSPHPPFYGKKKKVFFFKNYLLLC